MKKMIFFDRKMKGFLCREEGLFGGEIKRGESEEVRLNGRMSSFNLGFWGGRIG